MRNQYIFDAANLLASSHFAISPRSFVLQQVLMSNGVQHGPLPGQGAGAALANQALNAMSDHDIIYATLRRGFGRGAWGSHSYAEAQDWTSRL